MTQLAAATPQDYTYGLLETGRKSRSGTALPTAEVRSLYSTEAEKMGAAGQIFGRNLDALYQKGLKKVSPNKYQFCFFSPPPLKFFSLYFLTNTWLKKSFWSNYLKKKYKLRRRAFSRFGQKNQLGVGSTDRGSHFPTNSGKGKKSMAIIPPLESEVLKDVDLEEESKARCYYK